MVAVLVRISILVLCENCAIESYCCQREIIFVNSYSDRVFTTVSEKSIAELKKRYKASSSSFTAMSATDNNVVTAGSHYQSQFLGGVIIGIQKTQYDHLACLHIFSRIDRVMELLLQALELELPSPALTYTPEVARVHKLDPPGRFLVCYDRNGKLSANEEDIGARDGTEKCRRTILDLRVGSRVKMVSGPYAGDRGVVTGLTATGHYKLEFTHTLDYRQCETVAPYRMAHIMGCWYVEAAVKGTLPTIPIVNC